MAFSKPYLSGYYPGAEGSQLPFQHRSGAVAQAGKSTVLITPGSQVRVLPALLLRTGESEGIAMEEIHWWLGGFRKVAHFLVKKGEYYKTVCGDTWWASDAYTAVAATKGTPLCKSCLRHKPAKEQAALFGLTYQPNVVGDDR